MCFKIKYKNLEDVYEVYGKENIVDVWKINQILLYAKMGVQPLFIYPSNKENEKLVAYYFLPETRKAWEYWQSNNPKNKNV